MRVYLMRHGRAILRGEPGSPPEAERFLTPDGIEKTRQAARGLPALGLAPDALLSSPYLRAMQTAELAAEALDFPADKIRQTDALLPEKNPAELFKELSRLKADEVICFGHAPNVDLVIACLVSSHSPITALKKAGVAALEISSFSPLRGVLIGIYTPRALRKLGQ